MPSRLLLAACLLFVACEDKPKGVKLAGGIAQRLTVSHGAAAFLIDAAHPDDRTVPDDLLAGDLWLSRDGGPGRKVGGSVGNAPGAFGFSKSGEALACLAAWRFRAGLGELWMAVGAAEPVLVAKEASAFAWSPAEVALAFVAPGKLGVQRAGSKDALLVPVEGVQAIAFSPDGKQIAARAAATSGGKLYLIDAGTGAKREVAAGTSDFAFAPDGALAALGPPPARGGDRPLLVAGAGGRELTRATAFAFSPDGKEVALLSTQKAPGEATGDLSRLSRAGGEPQVVGQKVSDWRWGSGGDLLFLGRYDLRARAGTLTVSSAGAPPRELASKVQSFVVQGRRALFLVQSPRKGDFKIELWTADLASGSAARKIDEGVYGWELSPDGGTLFYKARCAGGPRSCSLLRLPLQDAGAEPLFLVSNVAGFDLSEDGTRVLLQQPHRGASRAVDLAVIDAQGPSPKQVKPFIEEVDVSSRLADASGHKLVYAVIAAGKGGVYAADVP